MKLQDAYFAETNALGTWAKIGYKMESNGNFTYSGSAVSPTITCPASFTNNNGTCEKTENGQKSTAAATGASITKGWIAHNNINMNDCAIGDNWDISAKLTDPTENTGASIKYSSTKLTDGCATLTPNYTNIVPEAGS